MRLKFVRNLTTCRTRRTLDLITQCLHCITIQMNNISVSKCLEQRANFALVEIVWYINHQLLLHVCLFGIHSDIFKFDILLKLNEGGLKRVLQLPTPQWQTDISRNYQIVGERAERVQRWGYECPVLVLSGAPASREGCYHQTPNMPPRTHWLAMLIENRAAKTTELLALSSNLW